MAPMYNDLIIIQKETGNVNRNFDFQMQREKPLKPGLDSVCLFSLGKSSMVPFYANRRHEGQASKGPVLLPAVRHFPYQFPCYTSKEIPVPETKETDRFFYASDQ